MSSELHSNSGGDQPTPGDYSGRKQLELLRVSSGPVIAIDQFMLANDQFIAALTDDSVKSVPGVPLAREERLREAARRYGGAVLALTPGVWGVYRDPEQLFILLAPLASADNAPGRWDELFERDEVLGVRGNCVPLSRVLVDTRCLVFVDSELLEDGELLGRYKEQRRSGDDKGARDLLRERGAAVRYGFNRDGDELGVFKIADLGCYALWPDVVEPEHGDDSGSDVE